MNTANYLFLSPEKKAYMLSIETIIALSTFEKIIVRAILMQKERRVLGSKLIVFLANQISKARFYDLINKLIEYSIIGKEIIEKQTYYFLKDPCEIEKKEEERKKALKEVRARFDNMFPENSSYVDLIETMDDVIALHEEINSLPLGTVVYTSGQGSLCMGKDNAIEWYDRFKKKGLINYITYGKNGYHFWSDTFHQDIYKHFGLSHTDLKAVQLDPQELYCIIDQQESDQLFEGEYTCITPNFVARFHKNPQTEGFHGYINRHPNHVRRMYLGQQAIWEKHCPEKEEIFYYDLDRVNKTKNCLGYKYKKEPQAETLCSE